MATAIATPVQQLSALVSAYEWNYDYSIVPETALGVAVGAIATDYVRKVGYDFAVCLLRDVYHRSEDEAIAIMQCLEFTDHNSVQAIVNDVLAYERASDAVGRDARFSRFSSMNITGNRGRIL